MVGSLGSVHWDKIALGRASACTEKSLTKEILFSCTLRCRGIYQNIADCPQYNLDEIRHIEPNRKITFQMHSVSTLTDYFNQAMFCSCLFFEGSLKYFHLCSLDTTI